MSVKFPSHVIPHEITPGDTFYSLAKHYNTTVEAISIANPGIDPNFLQVGQHIYIPVSKPIAIANIKGGPLRPQIQGVVTFYKVQDGTWICVEVNGLPPYQPATNGQNPIGPHGFHIHEFGIGKAVIIHQNPDDYRTQPAGNAGKRLACGVITNVNPFNIT